MELTYRKKYSCRESSQPSLITQSRYRPHSPQWFAGLEGCSRPLLLTPALQVPKGPFRSQFPSLLMPLAWQHRWSSVGTGVT